MKKRFLSFAVISALILSMSGCSGDTETTTNATTTTTKAVTESNDEQTTTTVSEEIIEEETTPEETEPAEPSTPTGIASDNIYNSTAPTNLSDDVTFSITVEYTSDPLNYQYDNNADTITSETFTLDEGMTLKMLSDKLATFGGLVETDATLSYSTDEEYKFAYTGFGYNLGISNDEFVDLYIEFEDESGNIIEDRTLIDENSIVKAIAVYEKEIDSIVNQSGDYYGADMDIVAPIISTPLRVKFNINTDELYEAFLGRHRGYLYDNDMGTLLHINNEKSFVANNSNYTVITCPDKVYSEWLNAVILVRN